MGIGIPRASEEDTYTCVARPPSAVGPPACHTLDLFLV
jgi:hypothetical protein